jgi:hypothetical protein
LHKSGKICYVAHKPEFIMLLKSYKNILPASVAIIGGILFFVGQPEIALAKDQAGYTPNDRPIPKSTRGGGSRLHLNVFSTPFQSLPLQNPIL